MIAAEEIVSLSIFVDSRVKKKKKPQELLFQGLISAVHCEPGVVLELRYPFGYRNRKLPTGKLCK